MHRRVTIPHDPNLFERISGKYFVICLSLFLVFLRRLLNVYVDDSCMVVDAIIFDVFVVFSDFWNFLTILEQF